MKAYRVMAVGFPDGIACGESASKVRSLAIRRIRLRRPTYTWKQGMQSVRVHRDPTYDEWANRRETPSIVTEESFQKKRSKKKRSHSSTKRRRSQRC